MNTTQQEEAQKPAEAVRLKFDYNKRLDELTSKISEIVRSSSLGLIAVAWLGLSATENSSNLVRQLDDGWLMTGAALALLALLFDFFQYVSGYFAVLGDKKSKLASTHRRSVARSIRFFCFYAKILTASASSAIVIIAISSAVLGKQLWF